MKRINQDREGKFMQRYLKWCGLVLALATGGATQRADARTKKASIPWKISFQAARDEAKRSGKPIMVDFHATWCPPCHLLDKETYSNATVIKEAGKWVALKVDVDTSPQLAKQYKITAMPTIAFLRPDGSVAARFEGYVEPAEMLKSMQAAYGKASKK
jgi:thiol:disulfide interchange protein